MCCWRSRSPFGRLVVHSSVRSFVLLFEEGNQDNPVCGAECGRRAGRTESEFTVRVHGLQAERGENRFRFRREIEGGTREGEGLLIENSTSLVGGVGATERNEWRP